MAHVFNVFLLGALLVVIDAIQPLSINDRLNQLGLIETTEKKQDLAFVSVPENFPIMVEAISILRDLHENHVNDDVLHHQDQDLWFKLHNQNLWSTPEDDKAVQLWGHASPMLRVVSQVTGCHLADTPPMYWPQMFAQKYMDNKTTFAVLQDPYTRVVDFFKQNPVVFAEETKTCDVDSAVQKSLGRWISGEKYENNCALIPQSEYFEGQYGAKLAIDTRNMTGSLDAIMKQHGYDFNKDRFEALLEGNRRTAGGSCHHLWAGSLSNYSKKLVKYVYENDFKLLCAQFDYCDRDETPCFDNSPGACQAQ